MSDLTRAISCIEVPQELHAGDCPHRAEQHRICTCDRAHVIAKALNHPDVRAQLRLMDVPVASVPTGALSPRHPSSYGRIHPPAASAPDVRATPILCEAAECVRDAYNKALVKHGNTNAALNDLRWSVGHLETARELSASTASGPDEILCAQVPEQSVVAKVQDDNGEATLITIIDEDGDGHLRLVGDGGDVSAEFCTKRGGGQDPAFTQDVRRFIGAVQSAVSRKNARASVRAAADRDRQPTDET